VTAAAHDAVTATRRQVRLSIAEGLLALGKQTPREHQLARN
jgi:hypothetical protein